VNYLLGYKKGMTQLYQDEKAVPVTVIVVPANVVCKVGKKVGDVTPVDIGVGTKRSPSLAEKGKYKEVQSVPRDVWTVWTTEAEVKVGDEYGAEICKEGDVATVVGVSKGKGFAGVVRRWGFHGGPKTHGQSDRHRASGAIGAGTDPGRIWPGQKMSGRMGGERVTLDDRQIVNVGEGYLVIKGPLPGNPGTLVQIELREKHEN